MKFTVSDWRMNQRDEYDVRTLDFKLLVDNDPDQIKEARIQFSCSLITELPDITGQYDSAAFKEQMAILAIAHLKNELKINPAYAASPVYKFDYFTENYPHRGVCMPEISDLTDYSFEI
jgi:hypothetical protein